MLKTIKGKIIYSLFLFLIISLFFLIIIKFKLFIPCIFHEITGLYCPGCGITRFFLSLLNLEIMQAFRYNMLIFFLLPFFIYYVIKAYYCWLFNMETVIYSKQFYNIVLIITILFGILRNIFPILAPTKIL